MTLYIIHGWTYNPNNWDKTIHYLEKSGIKIKFLKVPGLTAPSTKSFTIDDYVSWAADQIPDDSIALGHSNGGRILMNMVLTHPKKLKYLILLDSAGIYHQSTKTKILRPISRALSPLKKIPLARKVVHRLTGASDYATAPPNMKSTLENMLQSDKLLDPSKITTPTSIIWGDKDTITPLWQGKKLHSEIKKSTLKIIPGWTHSPYFKHPEQLAKEILAVLEESKS